MKYSNTTRNVLGLLITACLLTGCIGPVIVGGAATGATMLHDRRTSATIIEDKAIQMKANHELRDHVTLMKDARVLVTSYNRQVLIVGQVPSQHVSDQIGELIRNVDEVSKVYNELEVGPAIGVKTMSNDSWITTKIKSLSTQSKHGVDPLRTKVVTENGVVYMMGLVTHKEADNASELARNVEGVKRVVRVFEYID